MGTKNKEQKAIKSGNAPPNLPKGEAVDTSKGNDNIDEKDRPGYETANPKTYGFTKRMGKKMKKNPTKAEEFIWEELRAKKTGYKIRRQHIIEDFIVDFVCLKMNVVIEIDGKIHLKQKEYDKLRTKRLNELGYKIIRFSNAEVIKDAGLVANRIKSYLEKIEKRP